MQMRRLRRNALLKLSPLNIGHPYFSDPLDQLDWLIIQMDRNRVILLHLDESIDVLQFRRSLRELRTIRRQKLLLSRRLLNHRHGGRLVEFICLIVLDGDKRMDIQMPVHWNGGKEPKLRDSHDDDFLGELKHSFCVLLARGLMMEHLYIL